MDHLPYPINPAFPLIEVPYICEGAVEYDGFGFQDFPIRQRWMMAAGDNRWCDCDPNIAAARAQSWLYFGLLYEFFAADFFRPMFIKRNMVTGKDSITTNQLPCMLQKRFNNRIQHDEYAKARAHTILLEVEKYSEQLDALVPFARVISLSIKVLICSLGTAAGFMDPKNPRAKIFKLSPSRHLKERMLESRWCPYWIKINFPKYTVSTIHYLSALTRNTREEDHMACTTNECVAHNINMGSYKVKHITDDCDCHFMGPNPEKVTQLVQDGKIPLIRCTETPGGTLHIEVIEGDLGVEYTAISHVWSGGLGNPYSNTLPECQLRRLTKWMQKITQVESEWYWFKLTERALKSSRICFKGSIKAFMLSYGARTAPLSKAVFWLDTLCVPTATQEADLRRKAINQMAFIYAGADRVLILDPELQQISKKHMPNEQICAYLTCCAWRSRCWTYQEGCLARDRQYLLKDDLYHHSIGLRQVAITHRNIKKGLGIWDDKALLHSAVVSFWEDMEKVIDAKHQLDGPNAFITTWNSLDLRSTTKPEDLHGILAVLLGLSSREILSLELQERTKAIFRSQASLPLSLFYLPCAGTTIEGAKNKWISLYPSGNVTQRYGSMNQSEASDSLSFSLADTQSRAFLVDPAFPRHRHFRLTSMTTRSSWVQLTVTDIEKPETSYKHNTVCYILYNPLANAPESVGARFYVSGFGENKAIHLIYDCSLKYTNRRPLDATENLVELNEYPEVQGQETSPSSTFLIDSDFASWYTPRYRRPKVKRLGIWRNIYTAPVLIYIWVVWCVCLIIWSLGLFGPGVGQNTVIPAFIAVAVRASINYLFDMPLLNEMYQRLQYKQWSASLSVHGEASAHSSFKPDYGPLYQYRPQWTMALIIFIGCLFLQVGILLPSYSCRILGGILLVETIPRVSVELLWRRTRVGGWGTRFANRWLHRNSWEADAPVNS